jgi:NADH dehydrogenase [ubiquinone] 1 alpha subcomplex assembly factor 7
MSKAYMHEERFKDFKDGDRIELSPDSWGIAEKMAKYLDRNGGSALAIDYGQDFIQGDTLRVRWNETSLNLLLIYYF